MNTGNGKAGVGLPVVTPAAAPVGQG
jgi:hypothetical protein